MSIFLLKSSATSGGGGGGTILFNPGDLGLYANHDAVFTVDTNDHDGGISSLQSSVTRPGGSSKAIRIQYPNDEAGTQLQLPAFTATKTLYYRWYMYLDSNWSGHFPVGLKISRSFTKNDFTATVGEPGTPGDAYASPKLWMKYANVDSGFNPDGIAGDPNGTHEWGTCIAIMNLDIGAAFSGAVNFDNGLPYVRAGVWYAYEIYQVMNSADGVADGRLEIRVDGEVVYLSTTIAWVQSSSPRYAANGIAGWQSLWFGGNVSYGDFSFPTGTTLNRYEDGYYVSTAANWLP